MIVSFYCLFFGNIEFTEADSSIYPIPKSETNVSASEGFQPCQDINQFNLSVYSAPKSETPVTMNEKFERCKDCKLTATTLS